MLTKYEEAGVIYKDKSGNTVADVLAFFKQEGLNSMRVRLFVDPSKASVTHQKEGVVQDLDYVIALGKRIKAAGCILPVSHNMDIPKELGLRHRAAMGISQDSDAIAVVVSEETGRISVAIKGQFHLRLSAEELESILAREMIG